jgi:glycosyltransferase involved in cell wall biosynthesis
MIAMVMVACGLALIPALWFHRNLRLYNPPPPVSALPTVEMPAISVLIPARNEAASIRAAVEAALHSRDVTLEVIVLDDHSVDDTAAIVRQQAAGDYRVRLESAPPLPEGWCGKQHACAILARHASHPLLVFVDADVRLVPDGLARMAAFLCTSRADMISGVPYQETVTLGEKLLIPLIHFLLLGFLPMHRMRQSPHPAYGSGCGQLFMARREAYTRSGGHAAIRTSLHDGLTLPRAFRRAGFMTDLFDATDIAACRMYRNWSEVWRGLAKNAGEGLAAPATLGPATLWLLGGQVLPVICLLGARPDTWIGLALAGLGVAAASYPRWRAWRRFRQSGLGAWLHPIGIVVLLSIQWYAFICARFGRPQQWKGRAYPI